MATETLIPDSDVQEGGWVGSPDAIDLYKDIDEGVGSHDSGATLISKLAGSGSGTYIAGTVNPTLVGPFQRIDLKLAAKKTQLIGSTAQLFADVRISGVGVNEQEVPVTTAGYDTFTLTFTGDWSQAQIDTLEISLRAALTGGNSSVEVTAAECEIAETVGDAWTPAKLDADADVREPLAEPHDYVY